MLDKDNIDLNIIFAFHKHYQSLYEKGEIDQKALQEVFTLLDNFEEYNYKELKKELIEIFGEENLNEKG